MRHLKNVMKSNKKRQIIATFIDIATSDTYILNINGCLSRCLSRCWGYASGCKDTKDAVERVQISSIKIRPQPNEQGNLLFVERFVVEIVSIRNSHTSAIAPPDSFKRVRTHTHSYIAANRSRRNIELKRKIVVCTQSWDSGIWRCKYNVPAKHSALPAKL